MGKSLTNRLASIFFIFALCGVISCNPKATLHSSAPVDQASGAAPVAAATFAADAKLNIKTSYEVGEPIRVGCTCNPVDGVKLTTEWTFSSGIKALDFDELTKDLWAKPGTNKVSVKLKMLKTHKLTVFVQDPAFPGDPTKAKLQEIEVFDGYSETVLDGEFIQKGVVDPPPVQKIQVLNVVGMDYLLANKTLASVGFGVNLNGPGTGTVVKQVPAAGTWADVYSTVEVFTEQKPPDPPHPVPTGFKSAVLTWEFSKLPKPKAATDLAVEDYLRAQCGDNWRRWDDDEGSITDAPANLVDLWKQAKTDRTAAGKGNDDPWVEIELKDGKKVGRSMDDNTLQFLKSYGG